MMTRQKPLLQMHTPCTHFPLPRQSLGHQNRPWHSEFMNLLAHLRQYGASPLRWRARRGGRGAESLSGHKGARRAPMAVRPEGVGRAWWTAGRAVAHPGRSHVPWKWHACRIWWESV